MSTEQSTEQPIENIESVESPATGMPPASAAPEKTKATGLAIGSFTGAALAAIGSLLIWGMLEMIYPVFDVPAGLMIENPSSHQASELAAAELQVSLYNSVFALGLAGAVLASVLALGEGWARRSWRMAIGGLIGCAVAGAALGGLAGWVGHSVYQFAKLPGEVTIDLPGTVVVQMTMLAALGAGVGLVLGSLAAEAGTIFTRVAAGALAGVLAGLLWPFATANLLPAAQTEHIVPRGDAASLLWLGLTGVLLGLIVPGMKLRRRKPAGAVEAPAADNPPLD